MAGAWTFVWAGAEVGIRLGQVLQRVYDSSWDRPLGRS